MTSQPRTLLWLFFAAFTLAPADASEPLLAKLPPGVYLQNTTVVPSDQAVAIGAKLGGKVERLTNSVLNVHGRAIQVNVIACPDVDAAKGIEKGLLKIKPVPYVVRKEKVVVEYVANPIDEAIALKTSYELGFLPKPKRVVYKVVAEVALVDKSDYMSGNVLFNRFLAYENDDPKAEAQILELAKKFEFGSKLTVRRFEAKDSKVSLSPAGTGPRKTAATLVYTFKRPKTRLGVPFVTATFQVPADDSGFYAFEPPAAAPARPAPTWRKQLAATPHWPVDNADVKKRAEALVAGKSTDAEKVAAILAWVAPGKNIRYAGQTGSRWGTAKVLDQGFGHCWDFSDVFVTLARAAGIPCRQVAGWLYGTSGHVWAEYYDRERKGWQQVDPTGGGVLSCGIYHIPYFTTEDGEMPIIYLSMPEISTVP